MFARVLGFESQFSDIRLIFELGAEVNVGETIKIDPYDLDAPVVHLSQVRLLLLLMMLLYVFVQGLLNCLLVITQVALGVAEEDNPNESVVLYLKFGDQKLVLGTLIRDKIPLICFDFVFKKEFELSHNSKSASVHFCGYKAYYEENDYEYP